MTYQKAQNDCPNEYNKRHDFVAFNAHKAGSSEENKVVVCLYCGQKRQVQRDGKVFISAKQTEPELVP